MARTNSIKTRLAPHPSILARSCSRKNKVFLVTQRGRDPPGATGLLVVECVGGHHVQETPPFLLRGRRSLSVGQVQCDQEASRADDADRQEVLELKDFFDTK